MNTVVLNIETIPDPELQKELIPAPPDKSTFRAPRTWKDPEKIQRFIEDAYAEAVEEAEVEKSKGSLHPMTAKIICVSTKSETNPIETVSGDDEKAILEHINKSLKPQLLIPREDTRFNELVERNTRLDPNDVQVLSEMVAQGRVKVIPRRLITFRGKEFDIPIITTAMLRHRIVPTYNTGAYLRKYEVGAHMDLYEILSSFGVFRKGKLREWAIRLGVTPVIGKGEQVHGWWITGEWKSINEHCESNVLSTHEISQLLTK